MKRTFALFLAATALAGTAGTASADHVCVTSQGQTVVCSGHPEEWIAYEEICVYQGGRPLICV